MSRAAPHRHPTEAVVLVAHGSADPRAAATTRALARAVAAARPGLDVRTAYLDHAGPRPGEVLAAMAGTGHARAVVVPLLLTCAYHGRIDLPQVLDDATRAGLRLPVQVTDVLGPVNGVVPAPLLAGLRRRLTEAGAVLPIVARAGVRSRAGAHPRAGGLSVTGRLSLAGEYDAVVLAAAGTRDLVARATVDQAATGFGEMLGVPCLAGFASGPAPAAGEAVARLRAGGAGRVALAAYFLATGRLYRAAVRSARAAGVVAVAEPLGAARELAHLVLARVDATDAELVSA